jgi:Rieske Fe-S protein
VSEQDATNGKVVSPRVEVPSDGSQHFGGPGADSTKPRIGSIAETQRPMVGVAPTSATKSTAGISASVQKVPTPGAQSSEGASSNAGRDAKPLERASASRRGFMKGLAALGGVVAVAPLFALADSYLRGSVGGSTAPHGEILVDSATSATLKTTNSNISSPNTWTTFVYPRTGNPNIDDDTFRQWVIIHLPKGWAATGFGATDPISGDTFVALSRVCLHLWCLWGYVPTANRGICPCHGSQYLPGGLVGTPQAKEAGLAVAGPASLQTPPNNWLAHATIKIAQDGTISATNIVGQVGCGLNC